MTKKWPFKNFFYFVIIKCRTCHGIQTRSTIISNPSRKIFWKLSSFDDKRWTRIFHLSKFLLFQLGERKMKRFCTKKLVLFEEALRDTCWERKRSPWIRPSALNPKIQVARNCVSTQLPSWRKATKRRDVTWRKWATKEKKKKKVIRGEKCPRRKIGVKNVAKGKINAWSRKRNIAIEEEIDLFRVFSLLWLENIVDLGKRRKREKKENFSLTGQKRPWNVDIVTKIDRFPEILFRELDADGEILVHLCALNIKR